MNHLATPPVSAIADVAALAGLDGWLTPPLRPVVGASEPRRGRVRTLRFQVSDEGPGLGAVYQLLSSDLTGSVLVFAGVAGLEGAIWGEILSCAAVAQGAVAVLVDGAVRDVEAMTSVGLPVYARDTRVVGPNGRAHAVELDGAVTIDGVRLTSADAVAVDSSGCIRIEAAREWELLDAARRYDAGEERTLRALRDGTLLRDAYLHKKTVVDELKGGATGRGGAP